MQHCKRPFLWCGIFGRMAYCCNIYYLQNTSIWSSPPPTTNSYSKYPHIYNEWPWSIIAVHAALRHNSKSMQKEKKCQKLLRQFPYRCFLVCHSNMNCTFIICPSYIVLYQCEDSHIGVGATFIVVCRVESTYVT